MGKRRLTCPGCGKAIAVSEKAKKARCPGCKEVIDVAAAMSAEEQAPEGGSEPSAGAGTEVEKEAAAPPPAEQAAPEGKKADTKRKSSASRRAKGAQEPLEDDVKVPARPPVTEIGPLKAWLAVVIGCAVVLAVLAILFLKWYAAIAIVSALGLYIDSSLARITRVIPGSAGYGHAPMVWGLIGFVPVVGVVLYVLLRPKLVKNSPEDIAKPGISIVEMEDTGKIYAPVLLSPGLLLIVPLVALLAFFFPRQKSLVLYKGTVSSRRFVPSEGQWFNQGKVGFMLKSVSPLEEYGELAYVVVKESADGSETVMDVSGAIEAHRGANRSSWEAPADKAGSDRVEVFKAGSYRMEVKDADGDVIASTRFRIRR